MKDKTINELQSELDSIIAWFSSGEVNLDEAESIYKKGLDIATEIKRRLDEAEISINKIRQSFEESFAE